MNTAASSLQADTDILRQAIETACGRIAPSWPLDQLIAVNPYWGWVSHSAVDTAAQLGVMQGTRLTVSRHIVRQAWKNGLFGKIHLEQACKSAMGTGDVAEPLNRLLTILADDLGPDESLTKLPLLAELATRSLHPTLTAPEAVIHQISQHCAAFFDDGQAQWNPRRDSLWNTWRRALAADRGLVWSRTRAWLVPAIADWPTDPRSAIAYGLSRLPLTPDAWTGYLTALLLNINGWASWCAYRHWQAKLDGQEDDALVQLLAIRLAWDVFLQEDLLLLSAHSSWADRWTKQPEAARALCAAQEDDWLLQHAMELAHQHSIAHGLAEPPPDSPPQEVAIQALFCIDVRSEVYRRALESADPAISTRGFAGFFGLPIAYSPAGSDLHRPQLPGLLSPAIEVTEEGSGLATVLRGRRQKLMHWRERWAAWRSAATSGFSFVEICGPAYGVHLLTRSLPKQQAPKRWEDTGLSVSGKPSLPNTLDSAAAADLAAGIIRAMGLTKDFANLVLLAGHGSGTNNNPQAAGLDCGACGGQAGDINARVLAGLLNDGAVRAALLARGMAIPKETHFVPGMHNTTTDEMMLFDVEEIPPQLATTLVRLRSALSKAGDTARRERAPGVGLMHVDQDEQLQTLFKRRANDWSEVRPEWGLVNNASFVIAPRHRTKHLRLEGRTFLHDYEWEQDPDLAVLTLIMTAPMVVTNWINLQYHASAVDNQRYGSGNKLLHNVVGGHIGIFEGNGGDLRIGLPMQSLHDGKRWRHTPLRLSVFIESPAAAIEQVMAKHQVVRDLVDNGWIHLLRIDSSDLKTEIWSDKGWATILPVNR